MAGSLGPNSRIRPEADLPIKCLIRVSTSNGRLSRHTLNTVICVIPGRTADVQNQSDGTRETRE